MKIRNTFLALCMLLAVGSIAQTRLTGKITSPEGEELTGATIYVVNNLNRSLTGGIADINGNYNIVMPKEEELTIVCSFIGFKTKKELYNGQTRIDFTLEEDTQSLDAVEIIGKKEEVNTLGITPRKQTAATQKFDIKELENVPITSIESGLQGRMANVDIIAGADPGSRSAIRIRGTATLNANAEPLIVIDGVPYPTQINDDFNFATANDQDFGALVNISPNDIASIEVLKDAAATAIWGSQGANGVLIFTTKKGNPGKTKFSFTSKIDLKKEPNTIPLLDGDQYVSLMQDAVWNSIGDVGFEEGQAYTTILAEAQEISFDPQWVYFDEYNQNTNWMKEVTQQGYFTDNNFSLSGGGEKALYRISLGYVDELGTTKGTGFNRFNTMINVDYRFSDRLRVNAALSYSHSDRQDNWTEKKLRTPRGMAMLKMPNMSPYFIDEDGRRTSQYFTPLENFQGTFDEGDPKKKWYNPVAMVNESVNNTIGKNAIARFKLFYNLTEKLLYTGTVSLDIRSTKAKLFLPQSVTGVLWEDSYYNLSSDRLSDKLFINTENKLIYDLGFGKHNFILTGLIQTNEANESNYASSTSGNSSIYLADPTSGGVVQSPGSGSLQTRRIGFISNMHYTYSEKYLISVGYRKEGNSSLGDNSRWGGFATASAGWIFSEEPWLQNVSWLDYGKFRVSWGESGNPPSGAFPYVGTFSPLNNPYITMNAIRPNSIQLDHLKWETVTQTNIGADFFMFDNKLNITADVYEKVTEDLLHKDIGVPSSTGFSQVRYFNSGGLTNKGWELTARYQVIDNKDFSLSVNANISQNINEVTDLPENIEFENYNFDNGEYAHRIVVGNPIGSFYGYKYLGVYQTLDETILKDENGDPVTDINEQPVYIQNGSSNDGGRRVFPGDAKYQDVNGDGVIDKYDIVYLGNAMPILLGGGGFTARYKDISFTAFFYGRYGQKVVNNTRISTENMRSRSNQSQAVLQRWRIEGDDTQMPRALFEEGYNYLGSDRFVEDASFLRLKMVTLQYTLPRRLSLRHGIDKAQIWVTGQDLFTWTKYTGQDPEVPLSGDIYLLSQDNANTPRPKRYSVGINLNF